MKIRKHPCRTININHDDTLWLAGLLEGEGTFYKDTNQNTCLLSIEMTDRDIIERVANILNSNVISIKSRKKKHKDTYRVRIKGYVAINIMKKIFHLMGKRRKEQIITAIEYWNNNHSSRMYILNEEKVIKIKTMLKNKVPNALIAKEFNIKPSAVCSIKSGRRWKHVKID